MKMIHLKSGKGNLSKKGHPWLFSGAIDTTSLKKYNSDTIEPGEIVAVHEVGGTFLAYGCYHPQARIAVRLLEWHIECLPDRSWWEDKIAAAVTRRRSDLTAQRLIHAESDRLPGVIADRYGSVVVLQLVTAGAARQREVIVESIRQLPGVETILERSDVATMREEGLTPRRELLWGRAPAAAELVEIEEGPIRYLLDLEQGQKSGHYLDQADNRQILAGYAQGRRVLDAFCYSGGFSLHAARAGAESITAIDSSLTAIAALKRNFDHNQLPQPETIAGDLFEKLRTLRREERQFDLVILDPPKLAPERGNLKAALRAYKDLVLQALQLLPPGSNGLLALFSCSAAVSAEELTRAAAWAASDLGCEVQLIRRLSQGEDHPVHLSFPEGEYLKGILLRRID